jgi:hypothetical protein
MYECSEVWFWQNTPPGAILIACSMQNIQNVFQNVGDFRFIQWYCKVHEKNIVDENNNRQHEKVTQKMHGIPSLKLSFFQNPRREKNPPLLFTLCPSYIHSMPLIQRISGQTSSPFNVSRRKTTAQQPQ